MGHIPIIMEGAAEKGEIFQVERSGIKKNFSNKMSCHSGNGHQLATTGLTDRGGHGHGRRLQG